MEDLPVEAIMDAISSSKNSFTKTSKKSKIENIAELSFEDLVHETLHSGTSEYKFDTGRTFLSLDEKKHVEDVQEIDHDYVIHCPSSRKHITVGDIIIASERGISVHSNTLLQDYIQTPMVRKNKGLKILRRVTYSNPIGSSSGNCMEYETEDIHPLELFHEINAVVNISRPFSTEYFANDEYLENRMRSLTENQINALPSSGLIACNDNDVFTDDDYESSPVRGYSGNSMWYWHNTAACFLL